MAIKKYTRGGTARTTRNGTAAAVLGQPTKEGVKKAQETADDAKAQAESTSQYFWHKNGTDAEAGAHVTEIPRKLWEDQSDTEHYHKGANMLFRSNSIKFRMGEILLNELSESGMKVYESTDSENPVAQFLKTLVMLGKATGEHAEFISSGMRLVSDTFTLEAMQDYGGFDIRLIQGGVTKSEIFIDTDSVGVSKRIYTVETVTIEGHDSAIGSIETYGEGYELPSGNAAEICSYSLSPGSWIVSYATKFEADSSGYRSIYLKQGSTGVTGSRVTVASGTSSAKVCLQGCTPIKITSETTIAVVGEQNSGSVLDTDTNMRFIRIA